jgi:hypothetical protein
MLHDPNSLDDMGTIRLAQQILSGMPGKVKTVIRRASTDAIRAIKAEFPRAINQRWAITKSEVQSHMQLRQVSEDGGMRSALIVSGRRIPVMDFDVRPKTPPAQAGIPISRRNPVKIVTVRGKTTVGKPNRFVAEMRSGHVGVFMKKTKQSLPIRESMSESVPEMIRFKPIRRQIEQRAEDIFTKAIERNIKAALEKL